MKKQIPRLKAQKALELFNVAIYPNLTDEARKELYKSYQDAAYPYRKGKLDPWWKNPPKGLQLVNEG